MWLRVSKEYRIIFLIFLNFTPLKKKKKKKASTFENKKVQIAMLKGPFMAKLSKQDLERILINKYLIY